MWKYIYGTYRALHLSNELKLKDIILNGGYDTLFFNEGQFKDFELAGVTKLEQPIPLENYTGEIPVIDENEQPTGEFLPKLTRFISLKYSDLYTTPEDLTKSIENSGSIVNVSVFNTIEEAREWVRNNTNLQEDTQIAGKFKISDEVDMMGIIQPAKYLIIE